MRRAAHPVVRVPKSLPLQRVQGTVGGVSALAVGNESWSSTRIADGPVTETSVQGSISVQRSLYPHQPLQESRPVCAASASPKVFVSRPPDQMDCVRYSPIVPGAPCTAEPESYGGGAMQPSEAFISIVAIVPETLQNLIYQRSYKISPNFIDQDLLPFEPLFADAHVDPPGWYKRVTPEGYPYYWHEQLNLYTNLHLTRKGLGSGIVAFLERTARDLRTQSRNYPETSAAVSDLVLTQLSHNRWGHYFADNKKDTVFWVNRVPVRDVVGTVLRYIPTEDHLDLIRESHYWCHVEMFPTGRIVKEETLNELTGLVMCAYADSITSTTTTSPYSATKLESISKVLESVSRNDRTGRSAWIVARIMSVFKREMFLHYFGQDGARLNRDQSVHYVPQELPRPSYLFLLLSLFLFYMPCVYLKKLNEVYVDSLLNEQHWRRLLENLRKDWEMTVTPSTVLLGANVAFLAISSIDSVGPGPHRTPEQIMSYVSTICSLASYLVCWILVQRHAEEIGSSAIAGITYLQEREKCWFGLKGDAVVFSLPSALFTWSMLLFCTAVIWICIVDSDVKTRVTMLTVLTVLAIVLLVVLKVSWKTIVPLEDTFWTRNVEIARKARQASREFLGEGFPFPRRNNSVKLQIPAPVTHPNREGSSQ